MSTSERNIDKPRSSGQWTEARYRAFIISGLRSKHSRWAPKNECKRNAKVGRNQYRCACCGDIGPATLPPLPGNKRRRNNAAVDHITPVVDPDVGFVDWDTYIERMFVEVDGYQVLCWECHSKKTDEERARATLRRRKEKEARQDDATGEI